MFGSGWPGRAFRVMLFVVTAPRPRLQAPPPARPLLSHVRALWRCSTAGVGGPRRLAQMVLCEYSTEREVVGVEIHTGLTRRPRRETAMSTEFRCEVCDGYGVIGRDVDSPCPRCGGSGLKDSVGSLGSEA